MEKKTSTKEKNNTAKATESVKREQEKWFVVNAKGRIIGRLASQIAIVLMGKNKVTYQPYKLSGDKVIVINASKIVATGRKEEQKNYYRYSGYPGGLKVRTLKTLRQEDPERILKHAVEGMLPKTKLGSVMVKNLYIYSGEKHPHEAAKPEDLKV